jgi:hypothetical protein
VRTDRHSVEVSTSAYPLKRTYGPGLRLRRTGRPSLPRSFLDAVGLKAGDMSNCRLVSVVKGVGYSLTPFLL